MACIRSSVPITTTTRTRTLHLQQRRDLFNFPSPFASSSSSNSSTTPIKKGTLVKNGSIWVYKESKVMPYTPQQLYKVIADVDSYSQFLPFTSSSRVLSASQLNSSPPTSSSITMKEILRTKPWLQVREDGENVEKWIMDAELRIGAMGFDEGYVSRVELDKGRSVKATAKDASMFRHLVNIWTFTPMSPSAPSSPTSSSSSTTSSSSSNRLPKTQVDLSLEYSFTSPLHAAAISTVWDKVSGLMVEKFEKRVEEVYK